jgi:GTP-binding protein EngB required for normal cell division
VKIGGRPGDMSIQEKANPERTTAEATALQELAQAACELNAESVRQQALELEQRTREQRFYVACLGQFKRGKSTLLDALIGAQVLPTGILPVTAVPTIVRYGRKPAARVRLHSGEWKEIQPLELEEYVSEEKNPANRKSIAAVEVFSESRLLASGMCLVDTPGLGSIFESNTAATRAFLPHVDAAIIVIGADPPLSAEELSLVETVSAHVKDLIFVLNKADRVSETERRQAAEFARKALERCLKRPIGKVLEISATEQLQAAAPTRDWLELVGGLEELAAKSGASLAESAHRRGVARSSRELLAIIAERRGALTRPIEQSQARLAALREHVSAAESSLRDLTPLLSAEQQRMGRTFAERRQLFLQAEVPKAKARLSEQVKAAPFLSGPKYRRDLMRIAQDIARDMVLPWLAAEEADAGELYNKTVARFVALAENYLLLLAQAAGIPDASRLQGGLEAGQEFAAESAFHFHEMVRIAQPVSPFGLLRDLLLGAARMRGPFIADAEEFVESLLVVNSSRVENDFNERVMASRRELEARIRGLLGGVLREAEAALTSAQELMRAGQDAVEAELKHLEELETVCRRLSSG